MRHANYSQDDTSASTSLGKSFFMKGRSKLSHLEQRREATKHHGRRQRIRRDAEIDARGDDLNLHFRDVGTDGRDVPKIARSRSTKGDVKKHKKVDTASDSMKSQRSKIPDKMSCWTSISVRAAVAVMQAKGSEILAEKAANAVLEARRPALTLRALATEVGVAVLIAGGKQEVAVAVTEAIMNSSIDDASVETKPSMGVGSHLNINDVSSFRSKNSQGVASATPSMVVKLKRLTEREAEIAQKSRALEEAEKSNLQKEKKIRNFEGKASINFSYEESVANFTSRNSNSNIHHGTSFHSKTSHDASSVTPSMIAKLKRLKEREREIEERARALEEAERLNLQKEIEIRERKAEAARLKNGRGGNLGVKTSIDHNYEEKSLSHASLENSSVRQDTSFHSRTSATPSMTAKLRHLKEREDEIAKMIKSLEEAEQLNLQKEKEIEERLAEAARVTNRQGDSFVEMSSINHVNRRVNIDDDDTHVSSIFSCMTSKQRELKEKEDEIARKNKALDEAVISYRQKEKEIEERMEKAAQLNLQKEKELRERMAALEAKEVALRDRPNSVQPGMDWRVTQLNSQHKEKETSEQPVTLTEAALRELNQKQVDFEGSQTGNNTSFAELTGRLHSIIDSSGPNQLSRWQTGARSAMPNTTPNMGMVPNTTQNMNMTPSTAQNKHMIHDSYSTHSSASTTVMTNRTGDFSRARTATSAVTDDHRTWETGLSALTEDTGMKHRINNQMQNEHMLHQALYAAMNQYSTPAKAMPLQSVISEKSIDESSNEPSILRRTSSIQSSSKHSSSKQSSGKDLLSIYQVPSKSNMNKLISGFFSPFSAMSASTSKKPAGVRQRRPGIRQRRSC